MSLRHKKRGFIADTMTISLGTVASQGLLFLVSPILTRLYSPGDFGAFAIFGFLVAIPSVLACWCLEPAIILPRSDEDALSILATTILATVSTAATVLAAAFLLDGQIGTFFQVPEISPWLWMASIHVLGLGLFQGLSYWNTRKTRFHLQSVSRVSQSAFASAPQVAVGLVEPTVAGLVGGYVLGQAAASAVLSFSLTRSQWSEVFGRMRTGTVGRVLSRYRNFPLFSSWGTLMNITSFQVVPVLFSRIFTPSEAGYYFLGYRILNAPISLIGAAIGQVVFQRTGADPSQIPAWVAKILARMLLLLVLPSLALFLFAEPLFAFVFGEGWAMTGMYIQSLTPLFFLQFLTSPLSFILIVREKQKLVACIQLLLMASTFASIYAGGRYTGDSLKTVRLYSATMSAAYALYLAIVLRNASVRPRRILAEMTGAFIALGRTVGGRR